MTRRKVFAWLLILVTTLPNCSIGVYAMDSPEMQEEVLIKELVTSEPEVTSTSDTILVF